MNMVIGLEGLPPTYRGPVFNIFLDFNMFEIIAGNIESSTVLTG